MTNNEKILLLQLILIDIRGNWADHLEERTEKALELAKELNLKAHIESIEEYIEECGFGDNDGRFFRMSYEEGGYENMEILHGLRCDTVMKKSDAFKEAIGILTYPDYRFTDWKEYISLKSK